MQTGVDPHLSCKYKTGADPVLELENVNSGTGQNFLSFVASLERTSIVHFWCVPKSSENMIVVHLSYKNYYNNSGTYQKCPRILYLLPAE